MELRQLTTFRTAATSLNFTRTAALLGYAQSSVTAQIQALEEELGVALFDRVGKRVSLTEAGQRLLWYANKLLNLAEEAREAVTGEGAEPRGILTFSAPETLCTYRLPAILRQFKACFPEVKLVFRPTRLPELRRHVSEGALDLALLLEEPVQAAGLVVEKLRREPVLLLAPPDHPLSRLPEVHPQDLKDATILLTEAGCSYRAMFLRTLAERGVQPAATLEFDSIEAIKQCVMAGMGITVLPEIAVAAEIASGRLCVLRWSEKEFEIVTQMIWHKDKWLSPAMQAFIDIIREVVSRTEVEVAN